MAAGLTMEGIIALRARVAKLLAMLGSDREGERANALEAINQTLRRNGLDWTWIAELVADGEMPRPDREQLLARLVADRLQRGLEHAWTMFDSDAKEVRQVHSACEGRIAEVGTAQLIRAVGLADNAYRRSGHPK